MRKEKSIAAILRSPRERAHPPSLYLNKADEIPPEDIHRILPEKKLFTAITQTSSKKRSGRLIRIRRSKSFSYQSVYKIKPEERKG